MVERISVVKDFAVIYLKDVKGISIGDILMKQTITQYMMIIALVLGSYFLGFYKAKTDFLEKTANTVAAVAQPAQAAEPAAKPPVDMAKVDALFKDQANIVLGNREAPIKFVELSDPSCPFCHVAAGLNPELSKQMNPQFIPVADGGAYVPPVLEIRKLVEEGKAALVWLYTPGHGNGELGTLAFYCANEQGKFWEAHDKLMSNAGYTLMNDKVKNDRTKSGEIANLLKGTLDTTKLKSCLDSKKYETKILTDPQIATEFGYGATPTFFINNKVVEGASSWDQSFKGIVDSLL